MLKSFLRAALGAAAGGGNPAAAGPVSAAAGTADTADSPQPALFLVEDEDTKVYLFGTIHMLGGEADWFGDRVARAFAASDELIIEAVSPGAAAMQELVRVKAIDADGPPLSETLSPETYARFTQAVEKYGAAPETFELMDPWFAGLNLSALTFAGMGMSAEGGVETRLKSEAAESGKPVSGLETMEYQLGLFDTLPEDEQIAFLEEALKDLGDAEETVDGMVSAWRRGDLAALDRLINEDMGDPVLRERLLIGRNRDWAEKIEDRLARPGTAFVAVGAGHLAGEGSVQDALAARGIAVQRIE